MTTDYAIHASLEPIALIQPLIQFVGRVRIGPRSHGCVNSPESGNMSRMTAHVPSTTEAREIAALVVREFEPLRVVLFGSLARNEQRGNSDIDLMIVMPDGCDRLATMDALAAVMLRERISTPAQFFVTTPSALDRHSERRDLIYGEIARDGRELYAA